MSGKITIPCGKLPKYSFVKFLGNVTSNGSMKCKLLFEDDVEESSYVLF
jgi:hypothetical protein